MHWSIDVDSDIRCHRHTVEIHNGDGLPVATFTLSDRSGDWVVLDRAGTIIHRTDR